ncbi:TPA: DUF3299 domain-containing protein [Vibrio vulnificus]|nr:DUF3299 domain-containing protein [Vibrio vulnificus]HDY7784648.1 DUF3299 domain-containing protein [Vibrio vulnificus]HDY7792072.1 DUF3299 domain-containing protein [Vibrio vulnificus]HDY7798653.1 DUF3299 domain-containing protein [Vibrio vulnificus]HDY7801345.1 DUF3299 domain-containing protein [Vibrio vulnificus]
MKPLLLMIALSIAPLVNATETLTWDTLRPVQTVQETISPSDKALITEIYLYEVAQRTRNLSPLEHDGYVQRIALAEKLGLNVREQINHLVTGKQSSSAVIQDLAIDEMRLGGYLVPLEMEGLKGTQFILVPTAGACIHTPPPPANQTVLVEFPQGYELQSLYTPVWVKGGIKADVASASVALSDGEQAIETGYVIRASDIEGYQ